MVAQRVGLRIEAPAVDDGELPSLDMGNEEAVRPLGDDGDLQARLAERGQGFGQFQLLAGVGAVE